MNGLAHAIDGRLRSSWLQLGRRCEMKRKIRWTFIFAAFLVLLATNSALYPKLSDDLSAPPTDGWLKSGGNLFNQNYSPLTQINRQNVAGLKAEIGRASCRERGK